MRYIIIPLAILLYIIYLVKTFKVWKENDYDLYDINPFYSVGIILHGLFIGILLLVYIINFIIKYW